jgi:V/A-type H+-transporting ATPase subunit I
MLRPVPMQRVSLWVMREDLCLASQQLAAQKSFNPDRSADTEAELPESPGERYRELYLSARTRFAKIMEHCGGLPEEDLEAGVQPVSLVELTSVNDFLGELWQVCFHEQDRLRHEEENAHRIAGLLQTLDRLAALDLDLSILARPKRLLELKLGTLPPASLPRLTEALALSGFVVSVFAPGSELVHAAVAGPTGKEEEIAALLRAAGWRDMEIPAELMTHPEKARKDLEAAAALADQAVAAQCRLIDDKRESYSNRILHARRALTHAGPFATVSGEALRARGDIALISGWIPRQDGARVRAALAARLPGRHLLELRDPRPAELARVPSYTRYPRWLEPFASLVRLYGTPRYGEIDPTLLFAFAYVLMFGLMFGDVGQGALLAIAGLFLKGALRPYRSFVVAIGLSSTLFGFAYGSVFTLETILHPLWMSPLADPGRMLELAIQFGIGFILLTSVISIYNHWIESSLHHALYDASGIAGLVFYVAAAWWADGWMRRGEHSLAAVTIAVLALAVVLGFKWHEAEGKRGEKALIAGIEGFETAMGFFANTLSFLRVSAFALNHVALALAVLTIAEGMGAFGHWLTIVIGNVVIFVLEGAIVAIQALRLNYYEGFSRFFRGDGRRYHPLSFTLPTAAGREQAGT